MRRDRALEEEEALLMWSKLMEERAALALERERLHEQREAARQAAEAELRRQEREALEEELRQDRAELAELRQATAELNARCQLAAIPSVAAWSKLPGPLPAKPTGLPAHGPSASSLDRWADATSTAASSAAAFGLPQTDGSALDITFSKSDLDAASTQRGSFAQADPPPSKEMLPVPPVYAAALAAVEQYGWEAVHGDAHEWTALHWAATEGRASICQRLLACRANPRQPDAHGRTALDCALESGDEETWCALAPGAKRVSSQSSLLQAAPTADFGAYPASVQSAKRDTRCD